MSRTYHRRRDDRDTQEIPAVTDAELLASIGGDPGPQLRCHDRHCDERTTQRLVAVREPSEWSRAGLERLLADARRAQS